MGNQISDLQLRKIIKSSKKVKDLKKNFGLSDNAYVRKIFNKNFYIDGNRHCSQPRIVLEKKDVLNKKDFKDIAKCVLLKEVNGESAWDFYYGKTRDGVEEIRKYFGLGIDVESLQDLIFWGKFSKPFRVFHSIPNQISIEIFGDMDKEQIKDLLQKVKEKIGIRRMFIEAKESRKFAKQNKTLLDFDEKYQIVKSYKKIQNSKLSSKEKSVKKDELVETARTLLGRKARAGFGKSNLEKIVSRFKSEFGEI